MSAHGLASDGFVFIFVTISYDRVLKISKTFNILYGDPRVALGCLKYILEKTANTSPNLAPNGDHRLGDTDDWLLLDDTNFLHSPKNEAKRKAMKAIYTNTSIG